MNPQFTSSPQDFCPICALKKILTNNVLTKITELILVWISRIFILFRDSWIQRYDNFRLIWSILPNCSTLAQLILVQLALVQPTLVQTSLPCKIHQVSLTLITTFFFIFQVKQPQLTSVYPFTKKGCWVKVNNTYVWQLPYSLPSSPLSVAMSGIFSSEKSSGDLLRPLWCPEVPVRLQLFLWWRLTLGGSKYNKMLGYWTVEWGSSRMPR